MPELYRVGSKKLPATLHDARIIRDLGMVSLDGCAYRRFCELECPGCGKVREVQTSSAKRGFVYCRPCTSTRHGRSGTKLYRVWGSMIQRCHNPKNKKYERYGGRGITVCTAWKRAHAFMDWALSNGYEEGLSIDRIDNDAGYAPENCRWTTLEVQARNSRLIMARNTSGYRGVCPSGGKANPWVSYINVDNKRIYFGRYATPREAAVARDAYIVAHGLEHSLNFQRTAHA